MGEPQSPVRALIRRRSRGRRECLLVDVRAAIPPGREEPAADGDPSARAPPREQTLLELHVDVRGKTQNDDAQPSTVNFAVPSAEYAATCSR